VTRGRPSRDGSELPMYLAKDSEETRPQDIHRHRRTILAA